MFKVITSFLFDENGRKTTIICVVTFLLFTLAILFGDAQIKGSAIFALIMVYSIWASFSHAKKVQVSWIWVFMAHHSLLIDVVFTALMFFIGSTMSVTTGQMLGFCGAILTVFLRILGHKFSHN
jgi:hypothetical protein